MRFKSAQVNIGLELRHLPAIHFSNNVSRRVFCIGPDKSSTISLGAFLANAGFQVAPQHKGEMLLCDWARGDFRRLIQFCRRYEALQDVSFSYSGTYRALFEAFPDAKFILTKRNRADEWYQPAYSPSREDRR
ncbi:sulfotransferase [Nitrococcus mobilis]|uniref:sulfotransferase n=1 Tax=Nitrococcus mobilis TaxID=35797 RepID=UPI0003264775